MDQDQKLQNKQGNKLTFTLLKEKNKYLRLDVLPFIFLYLGLIYWYFTLEFEDDEVYPKIGFIAVAFLNCIAYLLGHWSVKAKALIQYNEISGKKTQEKFKQTQFIFVNYCPVQKTAIRQIVPLQFEFLKENDKESTNLDHSKPFCHFMEKKYVFDWNKCDFYRLKPTYNKQSIKYLKEHVVDAQENELLYDKNILEIPMKKFKEVLRDQLMEPFSFFQVFSVSLWLMDENRIYAMMTLCLLFFSACTVVIQRLRTMLMLRGMKLNPQYIQVLRNKKWERISSDDLVPGDICIIQPTHNLKAVEGVQRETDEQFLRREIPFSEKWPKKFFQTQNMNVETHKSLPADFVLLNGSVVANEAVLTGESVPQIKESIEKSDDESQLQVKTIHKNSILYCGTEVIQVFPTDKYPGAVKNKPQAPACLARVLRTGFDTSKGKLIRTVLHNNENLQIKQTDALFLIGILLIFSILSSAYVLMYGLEDEERSKNKLFLRCILIITTVVPPELPMILTISVNTSLLYLQRKKIFCTEPFRIPFGGKIDVCAFDKTGTLTSDSLLFKGILEDLQHVKTLKGKDEISVQSQDILAGCHTLLVAEKKLTGDPVEVLFFEDQKHWEYSTSDKTARYKVNQKIVKILTTFSFRSDLKRMSTIANIYDSETGVRQNKVLTKGAPEVIQELLKEIPEHYEDSYKYYTKRGYRVLALAYKNIDLEQNADDVKREDVEHNLIFAGLLICESPLKHDTAKQIQRLQKSYYQIIMITGDNILTAMSIGKKLKLGMTEKNKDGHFLQIDYIKDEFKLVNQKEEISEFNAKDLHKLTEENVISCSGYALKQLFIKFNGKILFNILSQISIYARTTPQQKELIITQLRQHGKNVLMCGDGTNDVGALKKSDVGIALVGMKEETADQLSERKVRKKEIEKNKMKDPRKYMQEMSLFESEINYKFGDACIAAPFTSKHSASIRCCAIVLRQGICALVTTIQTYKILTISSLIQAYSLSVLHMEALKFSEFQYTILGMSAAYCYFQFSNSKPLKQLSNLKPVATIFEPYFIISVVGQVCLHLYGTYQSVQIGLKYSTPEDLLVTHDEEFKPTFLNTSVFLFSTLSQTCSFLFNNSGEPHMEGFSTNKKFLKLLMIFLVGTFVFTLNMIEDLSQYFELKFQGIPYEANMELFYLFSMIVGFNYFLEIGCRYMKFGKLFNWI